MLKQMYPMLRPIQISNHVWGQVSGSSRTDLTVTIELAAPFYRMINILHNLVMYYANLEWTPIGYRVSESVIGFEQPDL